MRTHLRPASILGALIVTLLAATLALPVHADVAIAAAAPLTGSRAWSGEQARRGAELAVADINAAGGLLGQKVRLIMGDDAADPAQAAAVARKLVADGVRFVAGHRSSDASLAALPIYAEAGVVQISPSSTNPALTEKGVTTVFRVCGRDDQQGVVAAEYLAANWPKQLIGIVHDESAYGIGLAEQTKRHLNRLGVKEALFARYWASTRDFTPLVEQLRQRKIEILYIGGYSSEAGLITRQAHDAGYPLQIVSGDALHNSDYWMITGNTGEDALFTFGADPRNLASAAAVVARYRESGYEPEGYTLHTFAAIQVWAQAVREARSFDADAVAAVMRKREFDTVLGPLSFDAKGDLTTHSFAWYRWQGGSYSQEP